jgi:tRNA A37 threonylcarbamoyladenosine dehydratase
MCDENNCEELIEGGYDYIIDAIDMVKSKIALIEHAQKKGVPIISSMGAGNKLDPTKFEVADIYKTSVCPLAKAVRKELKKRNVPSLKVVYSKEIPIHQFDIETENASFAKKRTLPGSISFVPPVAGFIIAGEVIRDILKI